MNSAMGRPSKHERSIHAMQLRRSGLFSLIESHETYRLREQLSLAFDDDDDVHRSTSYVGKIDFCSLQTIMISSA